MGFVLELVLQFGTLLGAIIFYVFLFSSLMRSELWVLVSVSLGFEFY